MKITLDIPITDERYCDKGCPGRDFSNAYCWIFKSDLVIDNLDFCRCDMCKQICKYNDCTI